MKKFIALTLPIALFFSCSHQPMTQTQSEQRIPAQTGDIGMMELSPAIQQAIQEAKSDRRRTMLGKAKIKTDVQVHCGKKGQEFAAGLAADSRSYVDLVPRTSGTNIDAVRQSAEKSARAYETLCERSVIEALRLGISEQEVIELIKSANNN